MAAAWVLAAVLAVIGLALCFTDRLTRAIPTRLRARVDAAFDAAGLREVDDVEAECWALVEKGVLCQTGWEPNGRPRFAPSPTGWKMLAGDES